MKYQISLVIEIYFTNEEFDFVTDILTKSREYSFEAKAGFWFENIHRKKAFNDLNIPARMDIRELGFIEKELELYRANEIVTTLKAKLEIIRKDAFGLRAHLNDDVRSGLQEV